jgi:hypothetical protein
MYQELSNNSGIKKIILIIEKIQPILLKNLFLSNIGSNFLHASENMVYLLTRSKKNWL